MIHTKPNTNRETLRLFWEASKRNPRLLRLAFLYPLGAVFINTVVPLFIGKTIASLATPGISHAQYIPELVVSVAIGLLANRFGFQSFQRYMARTLEVLHEQAFSALLSRSVGFHNNNISGKLISDVSDYVNSFMQLVNSFFAVLIPFVAILVVGSALVFSQSLMLGLVITATSAYAIVTGFRDSKRRAPIRARRLIASKNVTGHAADTIVNAQTVKTFAHETQEITEHHRLGKILSDFRYTDWAGAATTGNNRIAVLFVFQAIVLAILTQVIDNDPALLGIGIFSFSFTTTIFNRLFDVNTVVRQVEESFILAEPMTEIIIGRAEIVDATDAGALQVADGTIALQHLHFAYPDGAKDQTVFADLNLNIPAGQKVGLVGPSGGGKSTLTRLLLRFEDIQDGIIQIDRQNIAGVTQASLRQAIAYVPQEPLLFHRSIFDNIAYGKTGATKSQVESAARKANALDFIKALPNRFDTVVGERGVKLSGGQRQRIAIARAILKDAPILVLDEATSALDSESEAAIQSALNELMQGRTTLVIAHRLSTIQKMDRIIVMDNGAIIEQGSHQELLKHKGLYAKLWSRQSGGFIED
jgi:ATP-binding cassette subfamily B protein